MPAARPRVPRFGKPYYQGKYKTFRDQFAAWLETEDLPPCEEGPLACVVDFVCKRPKNPTNPFPIGDIDNYLKAVWDSLQGHGFLKDDKQITLVVARKYYAKKHEDPHIYIIFWRPDASS